MGQLRMLRVATAADAFEARVIAARLGAEGVVWQLRGSVDGPLALGSVDILVTEDDYDTARDVLLVGREGAEPGDAGATMADRDDDARRAGAAGPRPGRVERWVLAAAVVVVVLVFALVRIGARV